MLGRPIVVLTGAGISAESGVATFRDSNGLWENHDVSEVATPEGFAKNPSLVHRFYTERRKQLLTVEPNPAHRALAEYARRFPGTLTLVTQNVDDLHERAGSEAVLHMHGQLREVRCESCHTIHIWDKATDERTACPTCARAGTIRPNIVWFGEMPFYMEEIGTALSEASLFISIGTSGNVYPAAGFFRTAKQFGAKTVELNLEPSENGNLFDETHYGPASKVVPGYLEKLASEAP